MLIERLTPIVVCLALALSASAQDSLLLRDYRFVKRSDPWLTSQNAAALVRFDGRNIAEAELSLTKAKGGLTNFDGSPDALQADAAVESFFRLSPRTVVFGAMSYSNFSGKDMAGSAFIPAVSLAGLATVPAASPAGLATVPAGFPAGLAHHPFDLVEDSLTNTGTKHLDTYRLAGGFGYRVADGFAVGARLDYTAANYAKYKDLRHQNKLMDLQLTAGIYAPVAPWLQMGAHYLYHRNTESVLFSTFGKTDRVYKTLIDYANFTGPVEQFGADGYTDRSREMPLVNDYNGLGFQFNLSPPTSHLSPPTSHLSFYNAFTYAHRRGYYGRKSPYTITYTDHASHCYGYDARLTHEMSRARQHIELHLQAENLQNNAATYREQQNDAGATYYEYYTPVKTANKVWVNGTVSYTLDIFSGQRFSGQRFQALQQGKQSLEASPTTQSLEASPTTSQSLEASPTMTVQAGLNWLHRKQTAYLYPQARRQRLTVYEPFVSLCRNIIDTKTSAIWSFTLDASFRTGTGEPYEDFPLNAIETTATGNPVPAMEAYLRREYRWLTAAQYQIGGTVKYAFTLKSLPAILPYVKASLSHRKANQTFEYSNGRDHTTAAIALGCTF